MGIKRVVDTDFWNDDKVMDMFSPEEKLFFLYLLTNPHTTQLGIYAINVKHMSFEIGYNVEAVNVLLDRFENTYNMIKYSPKTKEIAIKNFLKYSVIKGGKPVEDCLKKEMLNIKDKSLFKYVYNSISACDTLNETVKKILEVMSENENENEYENENENENERIVPRFVRDTSTNRTTNRPQSPSIENSKPDDPKNGSHTLSFFEIYENENKQTDNLPFSELHESEDDTLAKKPTADKKTAAPVRHKYGEYKNVLLSDEQLAKLKTEFPEDWEGGLKI